MITSLISGKLISDPRSGQSANGNPWSRVTVASPVQGAKENEPDSIIITVIAFGDQANKLENLRKGDSVAAVGTTKLSHWEKDGVTRTGMDLVATEVLTPYQVKQKRNQPKDDTQGGGDRFDNYTRAMNPGGRGSQSNSPAEFDDQFSF